MALFPMFVELKEKKCIVVGGGDVAFRKIEALLKFEADLTVIAPEITRSVEELGNKGIIHIISKNYARQDIEHAFLVVAATSCPDVNYRVYMDAVEKNIPVNVVDDPQKCTFIFPAVVKRGDLSIGISTSGNYPALSKKIRNITEKIFTEEYAEILNLLSAFRIKIRSSGLDQKQREKRLVQILEELYDKGEITAKALRNILEEHEKL